MTITSEATERVSRADETSNRFAIKNRDWQGIPFHDFHTASSVADRANDKAAD